MEANSRSQDVIHQRLTSRQADCAELAAKGLTSKEIARELNISPSTVDTHISTALARFNLKRRTDLSVFFSENMNGEDEIIPTEEEKLHLDFDAHNDLAPIFSGSNVKFRHISPDAYVGEALLLAFFTLAIIAIVLIEH